MPGNAALTAVSVSKQLSAQKVFLFYSGASFEENNALTQILTQNRKKSRQSGEYMTSWIWKISGTKRAGKHLKSTD